jgi:hypothetical protein
MRVRQAAEIKASVENAFAYVDEAIAFLSHLTHPPTRLALIPLGGKWTAVLNSRRDGSVFEHQEFFGGFCRARTIRVVDHPSRFVGVGGRRWRKAYEAHMVTLRDPQGDNVRTILCMNDGGRWDFEAYGGEPLAVEASFDYGARRKSDRFTHENVLALLESLGVPESVHQSFARAERLQLFHQDVRDAVWAAEIETSACTPEQADDPAFSLWTSAMSSVPHMQTHASSVVLYLTEALLLNGDLQPEAEPYLEAARRTLGEERFAQATAEARRKIPGNERR